MRERERERPPNGPLITPPSPPFRPPLQAVAVPGYQVPFGGREMPLPYGWGTGGIQVTAAIIGRDEQDRMIHADRARGHGVDKLLVAGNIHKPDNIARRRTCVGKAQVNRDPARLLLRQTIRVDPGQRLDERGLAVVNVPGRTDDHTGFPMCEAAPHTAWTRPCS